MLGFIPLSPTVLKCHDESNAMNAVYRFLVFRTDVTQCSVEDTTFPVCDKLKGAKPFTHTVYAIDKREKTARGIKEGATLSSFAFKVSVLYRIPTSAA